MVTHIQLFTNTFGLVCNEKTRKELYDRGLICLFIGCCRSEYTFTLAKTSMCKTMNALNFVCINFRRSIWIFSLLQHRTKYWPIYRESVYVWNVWRVLRLATFVANFNFRDHVQNVLSAWMNFRHIKWFTVCRRQVDQSTLAKKCRILTFQWR